MMDESTPSRFMEVDMLRRLPRRVRAASGDPAGAADAYRALLAVWAHADDDVPALAEVRAGAR